MILLQAVGGLALGLPGHLSVDSIVQLYEARTLHFISFHPPMMSLLLRVLDGWVRGAALFVVLDQILLTASFALLFWRQESQLRWPAAVAAALVVLNPLLLAYTGIVWKDVLMVYLAAFGYVCLYVAANRPAGGRIAWALGAVLVLAFAASARQHALVLAVPGAVYGALLLSDRRAIRWGLALLLCAGVVGINIAIVAYADSVTFGEKVPRTQAGLRSLAIFDLAGIAANGGAIPDAAVAAQVSAAFVPSYTPAQIGTLPEPVAGSPLWRMKIPDLLALWGRSILHSPRAYLLHRAAHFGDLLWRPCLLMYSGVKSTVYVPSLGRDIMPELGLTGRWDRRDRELKRWSDRLRDTTPMFNPVFWSIVLAACAAVLWRRDGAGALFVFAACTFLYALAFAVIGLSCDFRYLYILPVAATVLLLALIAGAGSAGPDGAERRCTRRVYDHQQSR
ncbi:MAG: hypothetical protein ACM3QY_14305 [Candidatus Levyibacteriota bacterium]